MVPRHREFHRCDRIGWLRAAVLGANDGIVSTASLVVGVAAAPRALRPSEGGAGVVGDVVEVPAPGGRLVGQLELAVELLIDAALERAIRAFEAELDD